MFVLVYWIKANFVWLWSNCN